MRQTLGASGEVSEELTQVRTMRISKAARQLIKRHEGLRLTTYRDPVGKLTIGWGHVGPDAREGNTITEKRAEHLLTVDIREAEAAVLRLVKVPLTQGQFDALVSWQFNTGGLGKSTLLRVLNAGDYAAVPGQMRRWVYGTVNGKKVILPGLVRRRSDESVLWLSGTAVETDEPTSGVIAEPPPAKALTGDPGAQAVGGLSIGGVLTVVGTRAAESDTALYVFLACVAVAALFLWSKRGQTA